MGLDGQIKDMCILSKQVAICELIPQHDCPYKINIHKISFKEAYDAVKMEV